MQPYLLRMTQRRGGVSLQCMNRLQNELYAIYNWAHQNNKLFNDTKFQAIRFGELLDPNNYIATNSNDHYIGRLILWRPY